MSISSATLDPPRRRSLQTARLRSTYVNLALWTAQSWLFLFYAAAGYAKLTEPHSMLIILLGWPETASTELLRMIGVLEVVLAVLLVAPVLSWRLGTLMLGGAVAIAALAAIMLSIHLQRSEPGPALTNLILTGLACAVIRGRARPGLRQGS